MEVLTVDSFKAKVFDYDAKKDWQYVGDKPAVIDFYADWCGPCRALSPILEEISNEYVGLLTIYKIDTEATPELAALFGVRGIPSLLFVPLAGEPTMATGLVPKDDLKNAIKEILNIVAP